jgi:hypothetical protein
MRNVGKIRIPLAKSVLSRSNEEEFSESGEHLGNSVEPSNRLFRLHLESESQPENKSRAEWRGL